MIITGKKFSKPKLSRVINGDDVIAEEVRPELSRLDHVLVKLFPEYNRNTLQTFIKSGYVTVDGVAQTKPNFKVSAEMKVEMKLPAEFTDSNLKAEAVLKMEPPVIFEDENVKVVDKPTGLLSMTKGETSFEPTLEDYGLLVHRLDRDTSGVVILAKNEPTQSFLRSQFQDRKTHKTYFAIVEGVPKLPSAMIDLPISRNPNKPTTFMVDVNGKPATTYYEVVKTIFVEKNYIEKLENGESVKRVEGGIPLSLIKLRPTTGRTHQLRVHLKYLETPILGDRVYGNAKPDTNMRLYLHAGELEVTIPGELVDESPSASPSVSKLPNQRKIFSSPLPQGFKDLIGE